MTSGFWKEKYKVFQICLIKYRAAIPFQILLWRSWIPAARFMPE